MSGEDGIVGFDDSCGGLRRRIDGELELGLLAIIGGKAFEQKRTKTGTSTATKGVKDKETLQGRTVV